MAILENILGILRKPFPVEESWQLYLRNNALVSIFVTFFLFMFQPFGINNLNSNVFLICLGFGAMTFLATIVFDLLFGWFFKKQNMPEQFTFSKWILNMIGVILTISLANFLFARLLLFGFVDWQYLPQMIYATFLIGVFPMTVIGGFALMQRERKYQHIAKEINQKSNPLKEEQLKERVGIFDIPIDRIRYIEALQNYVKIAYLDANGNEKVKTERATLKSILEAVNGGPIVKCHRSYLVNRDMIISTSGNAQGLLLALQDCDKQVPVSRSYLKLFRS